MADDSHASHPAVGMDAHQQMNGAAVAVRSDGRRITAEGAHPDGDIGRQRASVAKQAILNQHAVIEQMVVIAASREDLAQRTYRAARSAT